MRLRRVIVALLVLGTACAPSPLAEETDGTAPTTTGPTTPTPPPSDPPTTTVPGPQFPLAPAPEADIDPADLAPVRGRIAIQAGRAAIRADDRTIELDTGALPSQPTWSRDGARLVVASLDGPLPVVDVFESTGELVHRAFAERPYFFFSWSHDGTRIAALGPGPNGTTLDILDADGTLVQSAVTAASSLYLAWEPDGLRLAAHADDTLRRIDADGSVVELGSVGLDFFAPKWIPGSNDIVLVVDIEGTATLVRRAIEGGDTLTSLGPVEGETLIAVAPDGRHAAISTTFEAAGGGGAQRTGTPATATTPGGDLAQQVGPRSGAVEIIDLVTGDRTPVVEGAAVWTEWNPDGSRLLALTLDVVANMVTAWIVDGASSGEASEADAATSFVPAPIFFSSYLAFGDQFVEQPRLWAPTGDAFVYAELTLDGSHIRVAAAEEDTDTELVGAGEAGFWSPVG